MRRPTHPIRAGLYLALSVLLLLTDGIVAKTTPKDAVLLSSIKALTFRAGKPTTGRRVSPIPQLNCVGGSGCGHYEPDTIRCTNSGSSYSASDIEWTCQASLPPEFKLGSTDVVCEGYASPKDDYILKGSCGLEYRLVLTDLGEQKFGRAWFRQTDNALHRGDGGGGSSVPATLFWLVFVAVVAWMIYNAFIRNRGGVGPPRRPLGFGGGGGGGWGGGDDGHDDPPPPYSPQKPRASSSRWGGPRAPRAAPADQGWRPGFWTGLGAGAAATHLAGRAFGGRQQERQQGGWGWGGGGGGSGYRGESSAMGRRSGGGGGSGSSSPSYSSSRYTSTGFGGTSRR